MPNDKSFQVARAMSKRKVNILCLYETRWIKEGSRETIVNGSKLWYTYERQMKGMVLVSLLIMNGEKML